MRRFALFAAALLMPATAMAAPPPEKPKLVVVVAVDQFSANLFGQYRGQAMAGLARLQEGVVFSHGYQSHAGTETCPGHSTMLTGRHPSGTGIVANAWFDRDSRTSVYCVSVPGAPVTARGPQNLRATTLGDWMKAADPRARVISVSGKDRSAIMLAGHKADVVTWWDGKAFVGDDHAAVNDRGAAARIARFNDDLHAIWRRQAPMWQPLAPRCRALVQPQHFGGLDIGGAVPPAGWTADRTPLDDSAAAARFRASPLADAAVADLAATLAEDMRLGRGQGTDLLTIGLSATDYVGHTYGAGGAEMCEQVAALDLTLARLIDRLQRLGVTFIVTLTADHGGLDAVERLAQRAIPARRIDGRAFVAALNRAMQDRLRLSSPPFSGEPGELYILDVPPTRRAALIKAARAWLGARPEVKAVFDRADVMAAAPRSGTSPDALTLAERFHESFDAERSGDLFVALQPFINSYSPQKPGDAVAGHGSPWDYDRQVPILFWWPGAVGFEQPAAVETVDIAPTLAALTGTPVPPIDGRCLDLDGGPASSCPPAAAVAGEGY